MKVNFYTLRGKFLTEEETEFPPAIGTDIIIENPSGHIYSGRVASVVMDFRFEGEYAVTLAGKWEWEDNDAKDTG